MLQTIFTLNNPLYMPAAINVVHFLVTLIQTRVPDSLRRVSLDFTSQGRLALFIQIEDLATATQIIGMAEDYSGILSGLRPMNSISENPSDIMYLKTILDMSSLEVKVLKDLAAQSESMDDVVDAMDDIRGLHLAIAEGLKGMSIIQ
jgi:hypothetical protein